MLKNVFILLLLWMPTSFVCGQTDSTTVQFDTAPLQVKEITEEDLESYQNDPKFDYEVTPIDLTWWDDFKTWVNNLFLRFFEWLFGAEKAVGILAIFFKIIPYLLLVFTLYLLIRFFINVNTRSIINTAKNESIVSLSEEEHIIKNEDILKLIQEALANHNYRLAVRYYYLHILKLMSDKEIISWEMQKTNDDYIKEIQQDELIAPFSKITGLYNYIWYGNFAIDQTAYQKLEVHFSSLQNKLTNG